MRNSRLYILCIFLVLSIPYTYGGCSDSVGEDGGNESEIVYTGITSPAEINDANVRNILHGVLGAGIITEDTVGASADQVKEIKYNVNFRSLRIPLILNDFFNRINFYYADLSEALPNYTISDTLDGGCGGTMSYTVTMDNILTGIFGGSITFESYCAHGIVINGIINLNGVFNVKTSELQQVDFLFENLTAGMFYTGRLRFDGEISIVQTDASRSITLAVHTRDQLSGKVYYLDYMMAVSEYAGYIEVEISGEFYHPDYGYVSIETQQPLLVHDENIWPTSGILIITGVSGATAKLTVIDHSSCLIEVDFDGDGVYDWESGILDWEDI